MDYPKSVPNVGLVNGRFVDENASTGQIGSLIPAAWGSAVTDEILNMIYSSGLTPNENDNSQLAKAINKRLEEFAVSFATKEDAEAGTNTTKAMSPLRVFQAINKFLVQATEAIAGFAKIATQPQVNAGADDTTIVTPKKLSSRLSAKADLDTPVFVNPKTNSTPPPGDNGASMVNTNYIYQEFGRLLVSASETVKGIARFSSQTEVNGGIDDNSIVSPKKLRAGFQIQLAVNGYIYFPTWMGGMVWQWGNRSFTAGVANAFITPFPTEAIICWALANSIVGGSASNTAPAVQSLSATQMTLNFTASGSAYNFFWFAIGR